MSEPPLPAGVREGVREGILAALERDTEQRGARTARRLISAGLAGVVGSIGAMALVVSHPFGHHPHGHELVFGAVWTGLLIVTLAMAFLQIRTPHLQVGRAALVGLVGLGIAGACSLLCPDPHVMNWWLDTPIGSRLAEHASPWVSALCFGFVTTLAFTAIPTALFLMDVASHPWARALAAGILVLLLLPGLILGSVGLPLGVLLGWTGGTTVGAYAGTLCGLAGRIHRRS